MDDAFNPAVLTLGEDSLMNIVDKCFQRLALSPVANVLCFGLKIEKSQPSITSRNKKSSVHLATNQKQSENSVVEAMITEIRLAVDNFLVNLTLLISKCT